MSLRLILVPKKLLLQHFNSEGTLLLQNLRLLTALAMLLLLKSPILAVFHVRSRTPERTAVLHCRPLEGGYSLGNGDADP